MPGQAACLIRVPTEVVKSRTQTSAYTDPNASTSSANKARESWTTARRVFEADGLRGFYRGFGSTVMREVSPRFNTPDSSWGVERLTFLITHRSRSHPCNFHCMNSSKHASRTSKGVKSVHMRRRCVVALQVDLLQR